MRKQIRAAETAAVRERDERSSFRNFSASQLHCPKCRRAMPVREKLLLVLPDGELFDYSCTQCGTSLGSRKA